jgi:peptidoglycan/LPS O-acetylase OafA/YrhL
VANVMIAKFALPVAAQWALWGMGVMAAFAFAFLFHVLIDTPIQDRIRAWLKGRSRSRPMVVAQPVVSLEG